MTLTVEFDESGGYDCMTAAFRLSDGEKTVATIDLLDLGQKSCGDYAGCVEEARKFANLFSAAPDLLAALQLALSRLEYDLSTSRKRTLERVESERVASIYRVAIAKAKGEA